MQAVVLSELDDIVSLLKEEQKWHLSVLLNFFLSFSYFSHLWNTVSPTESFALLQLTQLAVKKKKSDWYALNMNDS